MSNTLLCILYKHSETNFEAMLRGLPPLSGIQVNRVTGTHYIALYYLLYSSVESIKI